jgi:hypothetical protein
MVKSRLFGMKLSTKATVHPIGEASLQMVNRFWWGAATGAYAGHGEVLALPTPACKNLTNQWSGNGGVMCGESPERIGFFRDYIEDTTKHLPFDECEGSDDGYVQALHCGKTYHLFRFYHASPFCNDSFKLINLPLNMSFKQELLDPWRMLVSPIWCGHHACPPLTAGSSGGGGGGGGGDGLRQPPAPSGEHPVGPAPPGWGPVGITVDDDSLPHILTFTQIVQDRLKTDDVPHTASITQCQTRAQNPFMPIYHLLGNFSHDTRISDTFSTGYDRHRRAGVVDQDARLSACAV